jgi:hypothetical protein
VGHLGNHQTTPPAGWLQTALKAVRDDDALAPPRRQLHDRVMRAWETRLRHRQTRHRGTFWLVAAASAALALTWFSSQSRRDSGISDPAADRTVAVLADVLLAPDVVMDDAASLQYVRLSLSPGTVSALGMPVVNPADDEPITVEALIGLDGIPRAIRYAQFRQESP